MFFANLLKGDVTSALIKYDIFELQITKCYMKKEIMYNFWMLFYTVVKCQHTCQNILQKSALKPTEQQP